MKNPSTPEGSRIMSQHAPFPVGAKTPRNCEKNYSEGKVPQYPPMLVFFYKGAHCNFIHRYQRYSIQKNFLNIDRIYSFEKEFFVAGNSLWVRPSVVAKIILQEKYMSKIKTRRRSIWNPRLIFFLLCWHQDLQHVYASFENDRFIKESSQCTNNRVFP